MLAASNEEEKERCMEAYREERLKGVYISAKEGRKMNEDVKGNRKLF